MLLDVELMWNHVESCYLMWNKETRQDMITKLISSERGENLRTFEPKIAKKFHVESCGIMWNLVTLDVESCYPMKNSCGILLPHVESCGIMWNLVTLDVESCYLM